MAKNSKCNSDGLTLILRGTIQKACKIALTKVNDAQKTVKGSAVPTQWNSLDQDDDHRLPEVAQALAEARNAIELLMSII